MSRVTDMFGGGSGQLGPVQARRVAEQAEKSGSGRKRLRVLSAPDFAETADVWCTKGPGFAVVNEMPVILAGDRVECDGVVSEVVSVTGKQVSVKVV